MTAQDLHTAMTDLRKGKITPDQFRAVMRESKAQHGEAKHNLLKIQAIAASNR